MRPAEVLPPAVEAPVTSSELEVFAQAPNEATVVEGKVKPLRGRGERLRRSEVSGRLWPRPVEQEDFEHLRRRHRKLNERRRTRWWRLTRPVLWGAATIASPVLAVLWLSTSPRFALRELRVSNTTSETQSAGPLPATRVSEAWVREALEPFQGKNLFRMSLADVAADLEAHPWVKSTSVSKELPQRLSVRIVEHREVALLRQGDSFSYLDEEGQRIAEVPRVAGLDGRGPDDPVLGAQGLNAQEAMAEPSLPDLPILVVSESSTDEEPVAALELLRELETVRPDWLAGLAEIEILGQDDFKLWIDDLPFPLLVRASTIQDKVRRLEELLPEVSERFGGAAAVDLRFDRRIIIQPSAGAAAGETS